MEQDMKQLLFSDINQNGAAYAGLSDRIWDYAETAYTETRSAAALAEYLEQEGFRVTRNAAGIATAFTASYGSGRPVIGFLGEFDALADLSQSAGSTQMEPRTGKNGHGCGHNLLGVGSLAACVAMKRCIDAGGSGTVIYFGCPAEEGGSGKTFMARSGLFNDLDAAVAWHPSDTYKANFATSLANYQVLYRFHGTAAHAGGSPHLGRSALDACELMNVGVQFLREHIPSTARIHYAILNTGGYSPNVVQAESSVLYLMRMTDVNDLPELYERVNAIAAGAAMMTGTREEHEFIKACSDIVPNRPLNLAAYENMTHIPLPEPDVWDIAYGKALRDTFGKGDQYPIYATKLEPVPDADTASSGSTDIGDVSRICPTLYLYAATCPLGTGGHTWQMTSAGKTDFAHKGMLWAAKVMAATALDMFTDPELIARARRDLNERTGGKYVCPIPDGVMPRAISQIK